MLARIQRAIVFVIVTFCSGWAAVAWSFGRYGWAFGGLSLVVLGYAAAIAFESVAAAELNRHDAAPPAS